MPSSMTSHASIGDSTFGEPRSGQTTSSSIAGPSDFTDNLVDYLKGNKQPAAKNSTAAKPSYLKSRSRLPIRPEDSGIIIESHSAFSDGPTEYRVSDKVMRPPAKTADHDVDGPSDFTANIVGYMRGTKPYSPPARASAEVVGKGKMKAAPPSHEKAVLSPKKPDTGSRIARFSYKRCPKENSISRIAKSILADSLDSTPNSSANSTPNSKAKTINSEVDLGAFELGIADLKLDLTESKCEVNALRNSVSIAEKKSRGLETELKAKNTLINKLQTLLKQRSNKDCQGVEMQLREMKAELEEKNTTINNLETSLQQSNKDCQGVHMQLRQMKTELEEKNTTINDLETSLQQSNKDRQAVRTHIRQMKTELEEKNTTINNLETSLQQSNEDCQGVHVDLRKMNTDINNLTHVLENSVEVKERTIDRMQREKDELRKENDELKKEIDELGIKIADKDLVLVEMEEIRRPKPEAERVALQEALDAQKGFCDDLKSESQELAAKNEELEATISFLQKRQAEMEGQEKAKADQYKQKDKKWQARTKLLLKEVDAQFEIADELTTKNEELEATILSLQRKQADIEEKQRKAEREWGQTASYLKDEIEKRSAACLGLWGKLEHAEEKNEDGKQKFAYKYGKGKQPVRASSA